MILEPQVLIGLLVLFPLVAGLSLLAVFLHVRRSVGMASKYTLLLLVIAILGLCASIMERSALDPSVNLFYGKLVGLCLFVFAGVFIAFIIHYLFIQHKTEEKLYLSPDFHSVFAAIDDLVLVVDVEGNVTDCNHPERLETLFGLKYNTLASILETLQISSEALSNTYMNTDQEGIYCYYQNKAYRISQSQITINHQIVAIALLLHDVTDLRAVEKELEDHNKALELANTKLENAVALGHHLEVEEERLQLMEALQLDLISRFEKSSLALNQLLLALPQSTSVRSTLIETEATELRALYSLLRKTLVNFTGKDNR